MKLIQPFPVSPALLYSFPAENKTFINTILQTCTPTPSEFCSESHTGVIKHLNFHHLLHNPCSCTNNPSSVPSSLIFPLQFNLSPAEAPRFQLEVLKCEQKQTEERCLPHTEIPDLFTDFRETQKPILTDANGELCSVNCCSDQQSSALNYATGYQDNEFFLRESCQLQWKKKKGILSDSHPVLQVGNLKRTSSGLERESFIHSLVFIKIDPIQYENNPAKPSYRGLTS